MIVLIRRVLVFALAVLLTGLGPVGSPVHAAADAPAKDPRALEILARADEAVRRLDTIGYSFENLGTGPMSGYASGEAFFEVDLDSPTPPRYQAELTLQGPAARGLPRHFRIWREGDTVVRANDEDARLEIENRDAAAYLEWVAFFWVPPQLARPEGFRTEIEQPLIARHFGTFNLEGEETDVIFLRFPPDSGLGDQYFYISTRDHLPRRITLVAPGPTQNSATSFQMNLSNVRVNVPASEWEISTRRPAGYETVDLRERSVAPGDPMPMDWSLANPQGERVSPSDFEGRVLVLDFFASWCPFCRQLMPGLDSIHDRYQDGDLTVLGVNIFEENDADAIAFHRQLDLDFPILLDGDRIGQLLKVAGTPTAIVVDKKGIIRERLTAAGDDRNSQLEQVITRLLQE